MAKGVNKVFLLGNLGKDPEIRTTPNGMTVASFSLATAERAKDQQGNWADKTEWHNLVCFQRTAEIVRDYVKKGSQLFVEGKIQTRSWDDKTSGEKKYKTEILVNELSLLGGKGGGRWRRALWRQLPEIQHRTLRRRLRPTRTRLRRPGHHRRRHPLLTSSMPDPSKTPTPQVAMRRRHIVLALVFAAPALLRPASRRAFLSAHRSGAATGRSCRAHRLPAAALEPSSSSRSTTADRRRRHSPASFVSTTTVLAPVRFRPSDRPGQYLQHGHIPMPRAIDLQLVPLGTTDELDALLTAELDQHIVTAVLIPVDGNWRRIATLIYATPFDDASSTPTTWVRTARALVQKDRYRAIFHASSGSLDGNFAENEAHLRVVNNHAIITLSFESTARECTAAPQRRSNKATSPANRHHRQARLQPCTQRWFQPDPADPSKHFELITGTGHISSKEAEDPLANTRTMLLAHLRTFTCQPYTYSDVSQHYEPTAPNAPCPAAK